MQLLMGQSSISTAMVNFGLFGSEWPSRQPLRWRIRKFRFILFFKIIPAQIDHLGILAIMWVGMVAKLALAATAAGKEKGFFFPSIQTNLVVISGDENYFSLSPPLLCGGAQEANINSSPDPNPPPPLELKLPLSFFFLLLSSLRRYGMSRRIK